LTGGAAVTLAQVNLLGVAVDGGAFAAVSMEQESSLLVRPAVARSPHTAADLICENRLRVLARTSGTTLPETDSGGWTETVADPSPLWGLTVTLGGVPVNSARLSSMTIDLDRHGGYQSCALTVQTPRQRRWPRRMKCRVRYADLTLFYGRLERQTRNVGGELSWSLEFVGMLSDFRDHHAFRKIYVDSDLSLWKLDQPPASVLDID